MFFSISLHKTVWKSRAVHQQDKSPLGGIMIRLDYKMIT